MTKPNKKRKRKKNKYKNTNDRKYKNTEKVVRRSYRARYQNTMCSKK
jgi:hypothetical protein